MFAPHHFNVVFCSFFVPNPKPGISLLPGDFVDVNKQWHMTLCRRHHRHTQHKKKNRWHDIRNSFEDNTTDSPVFLLFIYNLLPISAPTISRNGRQRNGIQVDVLFKVNSLKCKCTSTAVVWPIVSWILTHTHGRSRIIETYTQITRTPAHT